METPFFVSQTPKNPTQNNFLRLNAHKCSKQFNWGFTRFPEADNMRLNNGEMAEWLKAPVLKTGVR